MEYPRGSRSFDVEYAALGVLMAGPMHGYQLREQLSAGLGSLWRIASSQLYNVLHRLEGKGWIDCHVEAQSGRPSRNVYRVTPNGERAFWSWATAPVHHLRDLRIELLAKIYFLRRLDPGRIPALIDAELDTLRKLYGRLEARDSIESDDADFGRLALSFRTWQIEQTVRWLERNRSELGEVREEE